MIYLDGKDSPDSPDELKHIIENTSFG